MNTFEFTLRYVLLEPNAQIGPIVESLGRNGCDDALVGIGQPGRVALNFTREALCAREAVFSAVADASRAMPGAELVEASPDLVGLTDIAEIMGFSRQNMRKLIMPGCAGGPAPVHESRPSLWHLGPVLVWLRDERGYVISADLIGLAQVTMQLNLALGMTLVDPELQREIRAVLV
jgi:hypothetical protein